MEDPEWLSDNNTSSPSMAALITAEDEIQRALARIEQLEKDVVKHLHSNGGEQCIPGVQDLFRSARGEGSAEANQSTFGVGTPKGVSARELCPLVYGTTAKDVKLNPIYLEPLKAKGRPPHALTSQRCVRSPPH